jgi:hypothetical protein
VHPAKDTARSRASLEHAGPRRAEPGREERAVRGLGSAGQLNAAAGRQREEDLERRDVESE